MNFWQKAKRLMLVLGAMILLVACGNQQAGDTESAQSDNNDAAEEITVILDYVPNTNHTGLYVAMDKGYFDDVGIKVNVIEPGDGQTSTGIVGAGRAQFGYSIQEDVTYAHQGDDQIPVTALAAIIEHNTSGFYSLASENITSPKDFEGKVYGGWQEPTEEAIIRAVMTEAGANFDKLTMVGDTGNGAEDLGQDIDIKWFFQGWDGVFAEQQGIDLNAIMVRELNENLDYYTPLIIGNDAFVQDNPKLTKNFIQALKHGYQDAIANPEEATDILINYTEGMERDDLLASQEYLSSVYASDPEQWGHMEADRWDNYTKFMLEHDLIDRDIPSDEMFTNEYVD